MSQRAREKAVQTYIKSKCAYYSTIWSFHFNGNKNEEKGHYECERARMRTLFYNLFIEVREVQKMMFDVILFHLYSYH